MLEEVSAAVERGYLVARRDEKPAEGTSDGLVVVDNQDESLNIIHNVSSREA